MSATTESEIEIRRVLDSAWRTESPRIIASVARMVRDVGVAEDLAQDAFVAALEHWPATGVPANAGAWLTTAARRRAIDLLRRRQLLQRKHVELGAELAAGQGVADPAAEIVADGEVADDLLRLVFTACHPVLTPEARVALTLRLLGGLTTGEVARAFLVPEPTLAQRVVRAKRTLAQAGVPYEVPHGAELAARLTSVLQVVYLIFNEGYAATAGDDWMRPGLCDEALRLGGLLAELMPEEPEVHGLVALMEIQASRLHARVGEDGEPILLSAQDRQRWDHGRIERGLAALARAEACGLRAGPYALQAAIAACHARAGAVEDTDWQRIVELYAVLAVIAPSPVVELNRAVAVSMASGPAAGLSIADALVAEPALASYHLLAAVRGDFLERLGRMAEAAEAFAQAAALTRNERERALLRQRADECARGGRRVTGAT